MYKFKLLALLLVGLAFTTCLAITLSYSVPVAWDPYFHLGIAEVWARGECGMFSELPMRINHMPYPPLFHLMLVPSVWLRQQYTFVRLLQCVFYPLIIGSSMLTVWKHKGKKPAVITGMLLMSCVGVFDDGFQVIPQALDMMLLPVAFHFFLTEKKLPFVAVCTLMIYNHGIASAAYIGGLVLMTLIENRKKQFFSIISLSLPVMVPLLIYIPPALSGTWGGFTDTKVEMTFWQNPLLLTLWYLGPLAFAIPLVAWKSFHWNELARYDKALVLTVYVLFLPMIVVWPDRCLSHSAVPLSLIVAPKLANWKHRKALYPILAVTFVVFQTMPWVWLVTRDFAIGHPW